MTREQIKSAASEAALRMKFRSDIHPSQQGEALFIEGAEWRINSVWHDVSEKPENERYILVDKVYRAQAVWKQHVDDDWLNDVNHFGITRWAYVSDLLPERKEETK